MRERGTERTDIIMLLCPCSACAFLGNSICHNHGLCEWKALTSLSLYTYIAVNASINAGNVSALDRQNIGKYSAGPCEYVSKCD